MFKVIDLETNREANPATIALTETWAKSLIYCDMEGFAIGEDDTLYLMDECGKVVCCPLGRFRVQITTASVPLSGVFSA